MLWESFGSGIDLTDAVYALASGDDTVYAGTGLYGHVYKVDTPVQQSSIYLSIITR